MCFCPSADPDSVCLEPDSLSNSGEDLEEGVQFSVWVSFYEIYNEFLYDLLDISPSLQLRKRVTLRLSDDKQGNPYVKGERLKKTIHSKTFVFLFYFKYTCFHVYLHGLFKCCTAACRSQSFFFVFCQTSPGSKYAVLRRHGGSLEQGVVTRALPALTWTKTPAVGRTDRCSFSSTGDFVWWLWSLSLYIYLSPKQPQYFLHSRPAHSPRGAFLTIHAHQRVCKPILLLQLFSLKF